jgi:putative thiamine transport system permease protein
MAEPLRTVARGPLFGRTGRSAPAGRAGGRWLVAVPAVTLALFLAPIAVGLLGTWLPAFGVLPALGGVAASLEPWRMLFAEPGLWGAVRLTLVTGFGSALLSLALALALAAAWHGTRAFAALQRLLAPLLAMPHAALAIGLAFLLGSSGWLIRLGAGAADIAGLELWQRPPPYALVHDPDGIALILGLAMKETPFLLLMILAALAHTRADRMLAVARTAGYGPVTAWAKTVLPQLYPLIRLPVYAVLAFSLSVVDMALILGPSTPPPLAVLILRWFNDPDLSLRFMAAAGACLQLGIVVGGIALWRAGELAVGRLARPWLADGARGGAGTGVRLGGGAGMALVAGGAIVSLAAMAVWSLADRWRFPDALPSAWTLETWSRTLPALAWPGWTTLGVGAAATGIALALVIGCLEYERRAGVRPTTRALWLLYAPLLVPQIAFLFGMQVFLVALRLDGTWPALVWSHLLFVLPYVFLALADPWRALDDRYMRTAACLGASPGRVFWRVKLPMLIRPILTAAAIGFAVSVAQYLPTLFAGAGRLTTLTVEAVGLAGGADRRVIGVYAFAQSALPLLGFALALAVPAVLFRHRRGMRP